MATIKISQIRGSGSGSDISLVGPGIVLPGSTNTYTITDYDSFSLYSVSSSIGTATQVNEVVTLDVPVVAVGQSVSLSINRGQTSRVFSIALGTQGVVTPSVVYPMSGATSVPTSVTLQASAFATAPAGVGTHTSTLLQVARDEAFTDLVVNTTITTGDLTQYNATGLPSGTGLYVRVKYVSNIGESSYSAVNQFTTSSYTIARPTVSIVGSSFNVGETPTFNGSQFTAIPNGSDSHVSSTWIVRDTSNNVVWQLANSTSSKTSVTIPNGVLSVSTTYTMEVRYNGGLSNSMFSDKLTFTTAASFVPDVPGGPFGGGYYAGRIQVGSQVYAIVVAPRALGGDSQPSTLQWKTSQTQTAGTQSVNDGWSNTQAMVTAGIAAHPAANFCKNLTIGGYSDWYLPSRDELEILYRSFKPTTQANYVGSPYGFPNGQNNSSVPVGSAYTSSVPAKTSISLFQEGQNEAFTAGYYWSSTEYAPSPADYSWGMNFVNGFQDNYNKTTAYYVRAIRRVPI